MEQGKDVDAGIEVRGLGVLGRASLENVLSMVQPWQGISLMTAAVTDLKMLHPKLAPVKMLSFLGQRFAKFAPLVID